MKNIKTKEKKSDTIKTFNKVEAWTERIKDPIVYANKKSKEALNDDSSVLDYGDDKIRYVLNRTKDESIYFGKKAIAKTKDMILKKYQKKKLSNSSKINNDYIKKAKRRVENIKKVARDSAKVSKKLTEKGQIIVKNVSKSAIKLITFMIKTIISSVKSLVSMLAAGGSVAMIIIVIICIVGILVTSVYGIFFSSDSNNQIKMNDCIAELNSKMNTRIEEIKQKEIHDEIVIDSNQASWKEILSLYAIRVSNNNIEEVMTITPEKKKILEEIFWDVNILTSEIVLEKQAEIEKKVLHIYINAVPFDIIKNKYNFNNKQLKLYKELSSERYSKMWGAAIYGSYSSSGEFSTWKQRGREWSNLKIGNTNLTIGEVGCLVTSISILIKKSGVSTKNIYPFNPGTFVIALNNVYGFNGANLQYGAISKVIPEFVYQDKISLRNKSKSEKLSIIKSYYESGYYIAVEVAGATESSQHWVAVDNVVGDKIFMLDPGSEAVDMWNRYDYINTTQFVYFEVNKYLNN
ncbi:MAG: hypothetical protein HFE81_06865 [Bacilli bacterium]|nr:hypothetical protein [Bacilli bacterium]